jgi:hypothetical protein
MKRTVIALAIAALGFAGTAAVAEPTLEISMQERALMNAPEATSYQADKPVVRLTERDEFAPFNP